MSNLQQVQQQNNQLTQRVNELTRVLEDSNRKIQTKEGIIKSAEAENRKNLAEISRLHSENYRLVQQANRATCQKCSMRSN
jgi:chemotaxis regulatin CheY-phosphate phosphatase CheZ